MYNKKLYFHNNYQRDLYVESRKQRLKLIDNKIKQLQDEKQRIIDSVNQALNNDYNLGNALITRR